MTHPAITAHKKYYERVKNHSKGMMELVCHNAEDSTPANEKMINTFSQIIAILSSICIYLNTERQKVEGACEY